MGSRCSGGGGGGAGTVTSVDMSVPGVLYSLTGNPITGAGTLALTLKTQSANTVLAGPASGGAAAPAMRALASGDLPAATSSSKGAVVVPSSGNLSVDGSGTLTLGAHGGTHAPNSTDDVYPLGGHAITSAVEPFPRLLVNASLTLNSGTIYFTFFTAPRAFTVGTLSYFTSSTTASGLTLCRLGLYTADAAGNTTLVAATSSDTSLFGSANAVTSKALAVAGDLSTTQTSYALTRGSRYALALICVGTTMPTVGRWSVLVSQLAGLSPVMAATRSGQTDLTASNTIAQAPATNAWPWCYLT